MKNILFRIISVILVMLMLYTAMPVSAFAGIDVAEVIDGMQIIGETLVMSEDESEEIAEEYDEGGDCCEDDTSEFYENGMKISVQDGDATLVRYYGDEEELTIPSEIGGYPITYINSYAFEEAYNLRIVHIPASVIEIGYHAFNSCSTLEKIIVDEENYYFSSDEDGVLYNKEKNTVIAFPPKCPKAVFNISDDIVIICADAFDNAAFLSGFSVDSNNEVYSADENGILFNKDKTELVRFPLVNEITSYNVPDNVTVISERAFMGVSNLNRIVVPDTVEIINYMAFGYCFSLKSIVLGKGIRNIASDIFYLDDSISHIFYTGTEDEWNSINISENNNNLFKAVVCFNSCVEHTNTTEHPSQEPTCSTEGYTAGTLCNDCGNWISGHKVIFARHSEVGTDGICTACGENAVDISVDETKTLTVSAGETVYLAFVPAESGVYSFYSSGDYDTYGYLFDSQQNEIFSSDDHFDSNFSVSYNLEAGVLYYFGARFYNSDTSGSFDVSLIKGDNEGGNSGSVEREYITEGDFTYYIENSNAVISSYNGNGGEISIPAEASGYPVTAIGEFAFLDKTDLTGVIIPDSVTSIGNYAFSGCYRLADIIIPDNVTEIGIGAFSYCESLNSIELSENITEIKAYAFSYCIELESIIIPDSVTVIGNLAFADCYKLKDIIIPDSVTEIGEYAFANCKSLASIELSENITEIKAYAFSYCIELESIIIPDSVTVIGNSAFADCHKLKDIIIPDSVTEIGEYAFAYCESLTEIELPEGLSYISNGLLINCNIKELVLPENITEIKYDAFSYCSELESIVIPGKVTSIGTNAFGGCWRLTKVFIPESLSVISEDAFNGTALMFVFYYGTEEEWELIEIEGNNEALLNAKRFCGFDDSVNMLLFEGEIGENITWELYFDGTLEILGSGVMYSENGEIPWYPYRNIIFSVEIEDGITNIINSAFIDCFNLTSVKIPDSVTVIESSAFFNCDGLVEIDIPDSVTTVQTQAFQNCDSLKKVDISSNLTDIQLNAFSFCKALTEINTDSNNPNYSSDDNGVLFNKDKTTLIAYPTGRAEDTYTVPDSVKVIYLYAFSDSEKLVGINIPYGIERIESGAFYNCRKLSSVSVYNSKNSSSDKYIPIAAILPESVEYAGEYFLACCSEIKELYVYNSLCTLNYSDIELSDEYQLKVHGYADSTAREYAADCNLEFVEIVCDHSDTVVYEAYEATCVTDGFSEGVFCRICNSWVVEREKTERAGHQFSEEWTTEKEALCTEPGILSRRCTVCGDSYRSEVVCHPSTYPETPHPYDNNKQYDYSFICEGADKLILKFSDETELEDGYEDYIVLYNDDQSFNYSYSGQELKGNEIVIEGEKINISLLTNESENNYGFSFESITAVFEFEENKCEIEAPGHTFSDNWTVIKAATCTEPGLEFLSCTVCGDTYYGENYTQYLCDPSTYPETPHPYKNNEVYEYEFYYEGASVVTFSFSDKTDLGSDTLYIYYSDSYSEYTGTELANTSWGVDVNRVKFKLVTDGEGTGYGFSFDNIYVDALEVREDLRREIPALGHDLSTEKVISGPTCMWEGIIEKYCSRCDYNEAELTPPLGHDIVIDEAVEPTCTESGLTEGRHCTRCYMETVEQQIIPELGHDIVIEEAVEATCTETGLTEGRYCTRCEKETVKQEIVPELGHNLIIDEAVKATCTLPGFTEGIYCDRCDYKESVREIIPELGHEIVIDEAVEATCTETGLTEGRHCIRCDEETVEQQIIPELGHNIVIDEAVEATCTETGLTEGRHCSRCDDETVEQQIIPELGHEIVIDEAVEATCTETGLTEGRHCSRCEDETVEQDIIPALGHEIVIDEAVEATCTETGLTEGRHCSRCDDETVKQDIIPALGHDMDEEWTVISEADCIENGIKHKYCSRCDYVETEEINALGHLPVNVPDAFPQQCDRYAPAEIVVCARCLEAPKDISAPEYTHYELKLDVKNNCNDDGTSVFSVLYIDEKGEVSVFRETYLNSEIFAEKGIKTIELDIKGIPFGYVHTYTIGALRSFSYNISLCSLDISGNSYKIWSEDFSSAFSSSDSNEMILGTQTEHLWNDGEIVIEPDCTQIGEKLYCCEICSATKTESVDAIGHSYDENVTAPDCTAKGYTTYCCTACGHSYTDNYTDPLGHEYKSEYIEATDSMEAHTRCTCIRCEDSYIILDPASAVLQFVVIAETYQCALSWAKAAEYSVTGYNIYRKTSDEDDFSLLVTVSGRNTLSYIDKNLSADKEYSYRICAVKNDVPGEMSDIVTTIPLKDMEAPVVTKISPASLSVISGNQRITANATDNIGVTKFRMYFSEKSDGTDKILVAETDSASFRCNIDTTLYKDGVYYFWVIAYDAEGNESTPMSCTYTVDNTGPSKVTGLLPKSVLSTKITLEWDDVADSDVACYILEQKTDSGFKTISASVTSLGYNVQNLVPDTEYTFRVAAKDNNGNIGVYSDECTVRTAKDTYAPVITDLQPQPASFNSSIPFSATAGDDFAIKSFEIQVSVNLEEWETVFFEEYTSNDKVVTCYCDISLEKYADGNIYVRAVATDFSGNVSDTDIDTGAYFGYMVDKTPPGKPEGISAVSGGGWICISWAEGSEKDLGTYSVYRSTEEHGTYSCIASDLQTVNYYDRSVEKDTEYYYRVCVKDTTGNISDFSKTVAAKVEDDTKAPEVLNVSPVNGTVVGTGYKTVSAFVQDNYCLDTVVIEYRVNRDKEYTVLKEYTEINSDYISAEAVLPVEELDDGDEIYIRISATDTVGLEAENETEYLYTVDKIAPELTNLKTAIEEYNAKITWSDAENSSDISGYRVYRVNADESVLLLGSRAKSNSGDYVFFDYLYNLGEGEYIYRIDAIDNVGNSSSYITESVKFEIISKPEAPKILIDAKTVMEIGVEEIFDAGRSTDDGAIISYHWDFGDGTTSESAKVIKKYENTGKYTVTLTLTDDEGLVSYKSFEVNVSERTVVGTVKVRVVDGNGKNVYGAPIYFDMGGENQKILYTDNSGTASLLMEKGEHLIGVYKSGYLPAKKTVTALPNATRTVTFTIIEQELVTGEFEVTRMSFEEIKEAGIDCYAPENQQVFSVKAQIMYGSQKIPVSYIRNNKEIISYNIDSWGGTGTPSPDDEEDDDDNGISGGSDFIVGKKFTGLTFIPNDENEEIIAVLEIPATASYLKEFFDVKLHIINNASSDFVLENNSIYLDVPNGMTMMTGLSGEWYESPSVHIDRIAGQETRTISWVLRGDKEGEYNLTADFNGTLAEFNEKVHAQFKTDEPIRVYGLSNVKINFEVNDEIKYNALYFNIGIENIGDIDMYNPVLDFDGIVSNITASTIRGAGGIDTVQGETDFDVLSTMLNVRVEYHDGTVQYIPFSWNSNGTVQIDIDTLSPGDAIYYEYVAYNVIEYDEIAYFKEASYEVLSGYGGKVEVSSVSMNMFSMNDAEEKLKDAADIIDVEKSTAENIFDLTDYTYFSEYISSCSKKDMDLPFLYDDYFFSENSTAGINNGLALASVYLSSAAYNKTFGDPQIVDLLGADGLGFENIIPYNYSRPATESDNDFVAYTFATKSIELDSGKYDLVVIPIRGTPKTLEWVSDFNVGKGGIVHEGFRLASEDLYNNLEKYIKDLGLKKETTKFWFTGHSRGAAVANIIAEKLTKDEIYAVQENIYAYNFATPGTKTDADTSLMNIINYCNTDDVVPRVPLVEWGFNKAGQTINFTMTSDSKTVFKFLYGVEYTGSDKFVELLDAMYAAAPTVKDYYDNGINKIGDLLARYFSNPEQEESILTTTLNYMITGTIPMVGTGIVLAELILGYVFEGIGKAVNDAHCNDCYTSYLESVYSFESVAAKIKSAHGFANETLNISRENALAYIMDDANYMYYSNSSFVQRAVQAVYNGLKLALTLDFNTLTQEEQKETIQKMIVELITDDYTASKIDDAVNTQYVAGVKAVLNSINNSFSESNFSGDNNAEILSKMISKTLNNKDDVNDLANVLKVEGDEGLQRELIKRFAIGVFSSAAKEYIKCSIYDMATYSEITSPLMETMAEVTSAELDIIDALVVKPIESINSVAYAEYIHSIMNMYASSHEANLILDTIIASEQEDKGMWEKALSIAFKMLGYQMPVLSLLKAVDVDARNLVVRTAEKMKKDMNESFNKELEFVKDLMGRYAEDVIKSQASKAISSMLGKANVWYMLLGTLFRVADEAFGIDSYYKAADTFNIASYITLALSKGFNFRLYAYQNPEETDELNKVYGTSYDEDSNYELVMDTMTLLKGICNMRLLGEYTFKSVVNENNGTILWGDSEYDAKIISKCNAKFGTDFNNLDDVYDYIYSNILKARDAIFNVENTTDVVKPDAPTVTFNYSTLSTEQSFDESYEYCLSDGVWKSCNSAPIAVSLKTTTQVLRVRKASGNGSVAGHITTITIFAQKEMSRIVTARYDNGTYCFTNLLDTYTYEICPVDNEYSQADWKNSFTVRGGTNASVKGVFSEYIAIRTLGNSSLFETVSKSAVVRVDVKEKLNITCWGNGKVTQSDESGYYFNGTDVYLTAIPDEGAAFDGWYINGECVSKDTEYVFEMYSEAEIVARFIGGKPTEAQSVQISGLTDEAYTLTFVKAIATVYPAEAENKNVTWSTSDNSIATVDENGKVKFIFEGKVRIIATLDNGVSAYIEVEVLENTVNEIRIHSDITKTEYSPYENLDMNGFILIAEYKNGDVKEVADYEYSGYDNSCGEKNIVVTYGGKSVSFAVTVKHIPEKLASVNPTCTKPGYTEGEVCSFCGDIITAPTEIPVLEHNYETTVTAPTCTEEGYTTYTCQCGDTYASDTVDALGHTYDNACDTTCNRCSATRTITHSYNAATCTKAKTCKVCGATSGSKLGHTYDNACDTTCNRCSATRTITHSYNAATCTKAKTCKVCGATSGSKLGHTYDNACDTTCNRCSATRTITHSYNAATCTKAKTCKVCGATSGSKLSHTYDNACDTTCNRCSATRTITHSYNAATCTKAKTCKVCDATSGSKLGHKYSNACDTSCNTCKATRKITHTYKNVTTKATLTKNGKVVNKCTICGNVKSTTTVYYPKTIKLAKTKYTYNGKAQKPSVTVKDSKGNTLKNGTDYTVKYAKGLKNTGKYTVTVTFKGKYSGTKKLTFNILPSKTSKITPACTATSIKASWKKVTGADGYKVELLNSKGKVVKTATTTKTSYTFKKLSKATTYKVKVTAYKTIDKKAAYSSVSTTITTTTAPSAVTLSKVTAGKKQATLTWKTVSGASGYEVQYSTSKDLKKAKTVAVKKGSSKKATIKKLTKGKKYYFKVRAYKSVDGKKIYGAWSAVKSVKVK